MRRALNYIGDNILNWLYNTAVFLFSLILLLTGCLVIMAVFVSLLLTDKSGFDRCIEIGIVLPVGIVFVIVSILVFLGCFED